MSESHALVDATRRGDTAAVAAATAAGADVCLILDISGVGRLSLLQIAMINQHTAVARVLLRAGACAHSRGAGSARPSPAYIFASFPCMWDLCDDLIAAGCDFDSETKGTGVSSPAVQALLMSNTAALPFLVHAIRDDPRRVSLFMRFAARRPPDVFRAAWAALPPHLRDAVVRGADSDGVTFLHYVATRPDVGVDVYAVVLAACRDPRRRDVGGNSALSILWHHRAEEGTAQAEKWRISREVADCEY